MRVSSLFHRNSSGFARLLGVQLLAGAIVGAAWAAPRADDPEELFEEIEDLDGIPADMLGLDDVIDVDETFEAAPGARKSPKDPLADLRQLLRDWGTKRPQSDLNGDGTVGLADLRVAMARIPLSAMGVESDKETNAREGIVKRSAGNGANRTLGSARMQPKDDLGLFVAAWGSEDKSFDFDGDGTVGEGDIRPFVKAGFRRIDPTAKPQQSETKATTPEVAQPESTARQVSFLDAAFASVAFAFPQVKNTSTSNASDTREIVYEVGTPGTPGHGRFTWKVAGVVEQGTFVDGSPWITVRPGAQVIDITPRSERRATSEGLQVFIHGSAKNPRMLQYTDPQTGDSTPRGKMAFDARALFLKRPTQADIDGLADASLNVGLPRPGQSRIDPVPVRAGDVIVTAQSEWKADNTRAWTFGLLPHVTPGRRTAIHRYGVLTVLSEPVRTPSFRPPLQWPVGDEANRMKPIPVSRIVANEAPLRHDGAASAEAAAGLLTGPNFHEAGGVLYQSSMAHESLTTLPAHRNQTVTYGANQAMMVLNRALTLVTSTKLPEADRVALRNRLIQYGIDSYGATISLGKLSAGAGQRAAETKPWIILAGWWLDHADMRNPYQAIRNRYPGSAVAAMSDELIGRLVFQDDATIMRVSAGDGQPFINRWGPDRQFKVAQASSVTSTNLSMKKTVQGNFAKLDFTGIKPHPALHLKKPENYYGMYLKVESGPGSGPTLYRVTNAGQVNRTINGWVELDRPWQHGMPNASSSVVMFPFLNGDVLPGNTSDVGRWVYSVNADASNYPGFLSLSPMAAMYAQVSYKAWLVPYAALKRLYDTTGNPDFLRGNTWNWLAEVIGGTGTTPIGARFGQAADQQRLGNQFWDERKYTFNSAGTTDLVKRWLGHTGSPTGYGFIDRSRIPGAN